MMCKFDSKAVEHMEGEGEVVVHPRRSDKADGEKVQSFSMYVKGNGDRC
jgi:hypothetical protein